jgi:hypothetical protein
MRSWILVLAACGRSHDAPIDACESPLVYLNRGGGMWDHGARDDAGANLSEIVDGPRTLAAYPRPETEWTALAACVRAGLSPFPVTITEADPGATPHVEIVFTDEYWGTEKAFTAVIPDGCDHHEVLFVFGNALASPNRACDVTLRAYAQTVANLSFTDRCDDYVNDDLDCTPSRSFVDADANCAGGTCRCGGGTTQNTFRAMTSALAPCQ